MAFYTLANTEISRTVEVSDSGIRSVSLRDLRRNREYLARPCREFAFALDDKLYSSWQESRVREVDGNLEKSEEVPRFRAVRETPLRLEIDLELRNILITTVWEMPAGVNGMRKHVILKNQGTQTVRLSNVIFDDTPAAPGVIADCDFYAGNDDLRQHICFTIEGTEDMIRVHNPGCGAGCIQGSSAPGPLRYFLYYPHWDNAIHALNMSSAPFSLELEPGKEFVSPDSLISLYQGSLSDPATVNDFRKLIRSGLPALNVPEGIMYCTWIPFFKDISETLTLELAERAAAMGFRWFVLDDGWFSEPDRKVDSAKFPNGLEPLAERVRSLGMRFGLWLNIGTDYGMGKVPEGWLARREDGKVNRLGFDYSESGNVLCLGSDYRDYVVKKLDELTVRYGVSYFKLDFSSAMSPYGILPWGCHAKDHAHHRGAGDSIWAMYEGMRYVRDEMRRRHPEVILDYSFEAFGTERPNIAALELSPLHHVSNHSASKPQYQRIDKVRRDFYAWLGKLPPERILNGLLAIRPDSGAEYLLTSFAGAPLTAGDLRSLPAKLEQRLKSFVSAFGKTVENGPLTVFQVIESSEEADGFMRTDEQGRGLMALFNRTDSERVFTVPAGCRVKNVENGSAVPVAGAHDCAMFFCERSTDAEV